MHIVCGHCFKVNRLMPERLSEGPLCGECGQPLLADEPVHLRSANFTVFIERNDLPVVVDFWAKWCGPCRAMAPQFEQAAHELKGRVLFAKVATDEEPALAARYGIRSIPTLMMFQRGKEIGRQSGVLAARQIVGWLNARKQREQA